MLAKDTLQRLSKLFFIVAICIIGFKLNCEIINEKSKLYNSVQLKIKDHFKLDVASNSIIAKIKTLNPKTKESCYNKSLKQCSIIENLVYIFLVFALGAVVNHKKMIKLGVF